RAAASFGATFSTPPPMVGAPFWVTMGVCTMFGVLAVRAAKLPVPVLVRLLMTSLLGTGLRPAVVDPEPMEMLRPRVAPAHGAVAPFVASVNVLVLLVAVPRPELASNEEAAVYWKVVGDGTAVTVKMPL